jgi:hypothetical protein
MEDSEVDIEACDKFAIECSDRSVSLSMQRNRIHRNSCGCRMRLRFVTFHERTIPSRTNGKAIGSSAKDICNT